MNLFGILTIDAVTFLRTFKTTQVISCFDKSCCEDSKNQDMEVCIYRWNDIHRVGFE